MMHNVRRAVAFLQAILLLWMSGCAGGTTRLDREDLLNPPEAGSYLVTVRSGERLTFIALHLEGDDLAGTVRRTDTETVGEGDAQRVNVTNRYEEVRIPWSEVVSVETEEGKRGPSGALLAGGAIVLGAAAFLLLSGGGDDPPDGGGGGKNP